MCTIVCIQGTLDGPVFRSCRRTICSVGRIYPRPQVARAGAARSSLDRLDSIYNLFSLSALLGVSENWFCRALVD